MGVAVWPYLWGGGGGQRPLSTALWGRGYGPHGPHDSYAYDSAYDNCSNKLARVVGHDHSPFKMINKFTNYAISHGTIECVIPPCMRRRVTVVGSVCVSVKSHLTSGASVRPENPLTLSVGNGGQNVCGIFSETAWLQRSSTLPLKAIHTLGHFPAECTCVFNHAYAVSGLCGGLSLP